MCVWRTDPVSCTYYSLNMKLLPADSPVLIQSGFATLAMANISAAKKRHPEIMVSLSISVCVNAELVLEMGREDSVVQQRELSGHTNALQTPVCARDGPPAIRAAFTSQDTAGRVCVSVMKPYVAGEGPRLDRCSGIRWSRLAEAALASTTTRPRCGAQRAARRAYNHSTPEHPSGYTLTRRRFQQGGW